MWHDNLLGQEQEDEGGDKIEIRCLGKGKG